MRHYPPRTVAAALVSAVALSVLSACGGGATEPEPQEDLDAVLHPATLTFDALDQTAQLEAVVLDAAGDTVYRVDVVGTSSDPEVVTVDDGGLVTAVGQGSATLTTTAESVSGEVAVTVDQVVTDASMDATDATVDVGQTHDFAASGFDANGNPVGDATFTWSSSDESVATVDQDGVATGVASGSATIRAESGDGPFAEATLTVN